MCRAASLLIVGNLRTTTKPTTSVDWETTGTRTSVSAGKRKLKTQSVGRSTTTTLNRKLKQLRRLPQRRLQKNNRFNYQNNNSARASRFLIHFFDVHCTTTTWNLLICRFMEDVNIRRRISFLFLNLNKILKNSTPGKVACIWHIERVLIDAIKFERTQIHFFNNVFTAVVVLLA